MPKEKVYKVWLKQNIYMYQTVTETSKKKAIEKAKEINLWKEVDRDDLGFEAIIDKN